MMRCKISTSESPRFSRNGNDGSRTVISAYKSVSLSANTICFLYKCVEYGVNMFKLLGVCVLNNYFLR